MPKSPGFNQQSSSQEMLDYFLTKAKEHHGEKYDYSFVDPRAKKITIICPFHGEFQQLKHVHVSGCGCQKCARDSSWNKRQRVTFEDFVILAREKYGDKYIYHPEGYKNFEKKKIKITCPIHGDFYTTPSSHLYSIHGCDGCGHSVVKKSHDQYLIDLKKIHGETIGVLEPYKGALVKIKHQCNVCGHIWNKKPNALLQGSGCPICRGSVGNKQVYNHLLELGFKKDDIVCEYGPEDLKNPPTGKKLYYDFYIKSIDTIIEFDGAYHFKPNYFWTNHKNTAEEQLEKLQKRDEVKNLYALKSHSKFIRIKYTLKQIYFSFDKGLKTLLNSRNKVIIFSGGLDSTVLMYLIHKKYGNTRMIAVSFDYGQRHDVELQKATTICEDLGVNQIVLPLEAMANLRGSSLLKNRKVEMNEVKISETPNTYVPQRNSIFLTLASEYVQSYTGLDTVYIGLQPHEKFLGYWDTTPEYMLSMNTLVQQECGYFMYKAPFIDKKKWEIVKLGKELNVPFEKTWSCYSGPNELEQACGTCGACQERIEAFAKAGFADPIPYAINLDWDSIRNTGRRFEV